MPSLLALCPYVAYQNGQLLKDCVLVPYSFMTELGYDVTVMTAKKEEFTYIKYLPGLKLDIVPTCLEADWADYLLTYLKNYKHPIDVLFLFGLYENYYPVVRYFKEHYQGKVIMKLDANSYWVNELINPDYPVYEYLIKNCDLMSVEGRAMQSYLAKKWNRPIELIRNGSLWRDFEPKLSQKIKEKVILNVGHQELTRKNTGLLLKGFLEVCHEFPDWKLELIGPATAEVKQLVKDIYQAYPELKKRLCLLGEIKDKTVLESHYQKAQVYLTTSLWKGSPNSIAEALRNGCYVITSKIDIWQDTFAKGAGAVFEHGDLDGLKAELRKALSQPQLLAAAFDKNRTYCRQELIYESEVRRYQLLLDSAWR
ncbi:glycosyltransferase family 4 protein [Ligilactobacillus agilis]|uniref:glycosyltransferase family 4 protein n=1 Tax=Ligilactobacillus agilis TaxID=1601 RepID=UPI001437944C|nr:glycosyltransferase family 4 protein [Ligilactobacillus agilis]GET16095.1 hypothetical protein NB11A_03860 [Ligilactobacillus agilis]